MEELFLLLALVKARGIGPILSRRLLEAFGSAKAVFEAKEQELRAVEGVTKAVIRSLKGQDPLLVGMKEWERARDMGVELISISDPRYPSNLREIYDPPLVLYVKGELKQQDKNAVAVVGSRRCSPYGREFARRLASCLAEAGVTVVSGLARGIDTEAHLGALEAGRTIAVLGSGMDRIYPPENYRLAQRIASSGAVLSEFPLGTPPERWNFPVRNRVISGLSLGVVVVEASAKSGALITARLALEQGRTVFAVPGVVGSLFSQGTHRLIKEGAKLVEGPEDVLEEIMPQLEFPERGKPLQGFSPDEEMVLEILREGPKHVDELLRILKLEASSLNPLLMGLELKGIVKQLPGRIYILCS